jgi:hypothetical protein
LTGPVTRNTNLDFLLARVEQARSEAEAATLVHVRERCRRSVAAWTALADRALRSEELRHAEQERKAARDLPPENNDTNDKIYENQENDSEAQVSF